MKTIISGSHLVYSFILKYLILLLDKGTLCVHSNAVQALAGGTITALKTWTTSTAMGKQSTTPIIKLIQEYCQTTPLLRLN